jgi:hypothetical protein
MRARNYINFDPTEAFWRRDLLVRRINRRLGGYQRLERSEQVDVFDLYDWSWSGSKPRRRKVDVLELGLKLGAATVGDVLDYLIQSGVAKLTQGPPVMKNLEKTPTADSLEDIACEST